MSSNFPSLIISRHRTETATAIETAAVLAAKFNVSVWNVPFLYDLPESGPVIESLRTLPQPGNFLIPLAQRAAANLLHQMQIPFAAVFETPDSVQLPDGGIPGGIAERFEEITSERWYPIIDQNRCAGCLECVNYCLFGVYSIGTDSHPFVCQPDACRNGCPACARVCPGRAIMFPLYEDRSIAGYEMKEHDPLDGFIDVVEQI